MKKSNKISDLIEGL